MAGDRSVRATPGLRHNAVWLMASQVLSLGLQLVWAKRIASAIGVDGLGVYSYGLALTQTLGIVADFGMNIFLVREVARDRTQAPAMLGNALVFKLAASVVAWAALAAVLALSHASAADVTVIVIFMTAVAMQTVAAIYVSLWRAFETMSYEAVAGVLMNLLNLVLCFIALARGLPLVWFAAAYAAASLVQLAVMMGSYHAVHPGLSVGLERRFVSVWWRSVVWLGLGGMFFFIYDRGPQLLLSHLGTMTQVGEYAAGYRLIMAVLLVPAIISSALLPRFAVLMAASDHQQLRRLLVRIVALLAAVGVLISLALSLSAGHLVRFFYGPAFAAAGATLRCLAWLPAIVFPGAILTTLMVAIGGDRRYALYSGVEMIIGIVGCVLLIGRFGAAGAAISVLVAALLTNIAIGIDVVITNRRLWAHAIV